jgi:FkbM family methyltransferase
MSPIEPLRWPKLRDLRADGRGRLLLRRALAIRGGRHERRAAARDLVFRLARNFTPGFVIEVDGARYHLDTADRGVSRIVFIYGLYDRPAMEAAFAALAHNGGPSDLDGRGFLDMGANIGSATVLAATQFGAAGGYAVEPDPDNFRTLRLNLEANGLTERVRAFQLALSDTSGTVEFERSEDNYGDHRVRVAGSQADEELNESARPVIAVEARTLDELVERGDVDLADIGLAWIDVQGHEAHLLAGATTLLSSEIPVVVELWPYGLRAGGALDRFRELLGAHYDRFVDLGGPKGEPSVQSQPIGALEAISARHARHDEHTDLLLLPG